MNWRPIKTAPKDGTSILVAFDPMVGYQQIVRWHEKKSGWRWVDSYTLKKICNEPTHWMGLPDNPYGSCLWCGSGRPRQNTPVDK